MVRVSRDTEAVPLLVRNDALRGDDARGSRWGLRNSAHAGSPSLTLVATAVLCASGVAMYAASTIISAEQIRDVRQKVDATRRERGALLDEELLAQTSADLHAELRASPHAAGDLGAFDTTGVTPDASYVVRASEVVSSSSSSSSSSSPRAPLGTVAADNSTVAADDGEYASEEDSEEISEEERERAEEWVEAQNIAAEALESETMATLVQTTIESGLTPEEIEERAAEFEDYQNGKEAEAPADAPDEEMIVLAEAPAEAPSDCETDASESAAEDTETNDDANAPADAPTDDDANAPADASTDVDAPTDEDEPVEAEDPEAAEAAPSQTESPDEASSDAESSPESLGESLRVASQLGKTLDPAATSDPQARARLAQALTQALAQAEAQTQAQEATAEQGQATPDAPEYDGASPVWVAVQALLNDESRNHEAVLTRMNDAIGGAYLNGGLPTHVMVESGPDEARPMPEGADPSEYAQTESQASGGFKREFSPTMYEFDRGAPWPTNVAMVVAHYNEWDELERIPDWANNTVDPATRPASPRGLGYTVAPIYQRKHPDRANFVPNHGFEGGAYIKYVLDFYDNLPDVTIFVQADAGGLPDFAGRLSTIVANADKITYTPLNVASDKEEWSTYFHKRIPYQEWWMSSDLRKVDKCWRSVAGMFGHSWPENVVPQVSGYCCNLFAASRDNIRRVPKDVWQHLYDNLIVNGECIPGEGPVQNRDDDKWQLGIVLEHMSHVMFGGHFPHYPRHCGAAGNQYVGAQLFSDECCDGRSCLAKGWFDIEDTDWMADPVEVKDDPPNLARIPPADLPQESWSDEGYSASGLFAAKLGESYHFGLKPLKENDPDKMRAAFEKGIAELLNYGSLPEVWQRAVQTGRAVMELATSNALMLRAHATSARAQSLLGIRGVRGERHPSTSLENNDAPESAAARSAALAAARAVDGKAPKSTSARAAAKKAPKSTSARAAAEKN